MPDVDVAVVAHGQGRVARARQAGLAPYLVAILSGLDRTTVESALDDGADDFLLTGCAACEIEARVCRVGRKRKPPTLATPEQLVGWAEAPRTLSQEVSRSRPRTLPWCAPPSSPTPPLVGRSWSAWACP